MAPNDEEEEGEEEPILVDEGIEINSPVKILDRKDNDDVTIVDLVDLIAPSLAVAAQITQKTLTSQAQQAPRAVINLTRVNDYLDGFAYCIS